MKKKITILSILLLLAASSAWAQEQDRPLARRSEDATPSEGEAPEKSYIYMIAQ